MHTFRKSLMATNARTGRDELRTPQHKTYREQFEKKQVSGSGRPCHPSRSQSPTCRNNTGMSQHCSSPPPYSRMHSSASSPSKQPSFQQGASSKSPTVCALCLGWEACDLLKCKSSTFWDGSKARCQKNDQGQLVSSSGLVLCFDWNIQRGCTAQGHKDRHECSGCENKDHGTQKCPQAQKKPGAHSI